MVDLPKMVVFHSYVSLLDDLFHDISWKIPRKHGYTWMINIDNWAIPSF